MQCVFTVIRFAGRNPIKMMKKAHLGTLQGLGRVAERSAEREVITVVKLTGNVASP